MGLALWIMPLTVVLMIYMVAYHAVLWRWRKKSYSKLTTFLTTLVVLFIMQFSLANYDPIFAALPIFGLIAVFVRTVLVQRGAPTTEPLSKLNAASYIALVGGMAWLLGTEYAHTPRTGVELAFPLANANHPVMRGGYTLLFNHHRVVKEQEWALDLGRPFGVTEMVAIMRGRAHEFRVFGEPVFAPCDGEVLSVEDGHSDLPLGEMDSKHVAGNHVILQCKTNPQVRVRLAHFKLNSVEVRPGEKLQVGDRVARVGNSGHTSMPHLHIEAQNEAGDAVPLFFGGRFYRGYDRFTDDAATATQRASRA